MELVQGRMGEHGYLLFGSVVVVGPADILVGGRQGAGGIRARGWPAVEPMAQDGVPARESSALRWRAPAHMRPPAARLRTPCLAASRLSRHESLGYRVTAGGEDGLYKGGGGGTAFRGEAATQALRSPLGMSRMCFGHVLRERGVPAARRGAQVTCHAAPRGATPRLWWR